MHHHHKKLNITDIIEAPGIFHLVPLPLSLLRGHHYPKFGFLCVVPRMF